MKKKIISLALALSMAGTAIPYFATAADTGLVPAFPGAEGAGKYATGGRGGKVYHVTNLNDSGTGSFRDAVSGSNRIVVFDVGGTVELKSDVVVKGNITIAGQTAPGGGGITLRGGKIGMGGDNIIVRFVSSRPGENGESECDAWGGSKGSNSIIDHCSIGWANDEQFGLYSNNMHQTVQYSIIGPSNCISYHSKGAHGFGVMFGKGHNSWHHNMIAHNISRNFRGKVEKTNAMDYVNNVIFNWGYQTAYGTFGQINYVGNYFKEGLSTRGGNRFINISSGTAPENYRFYLTGNKMVTETGADYNTSMNSNNWIGVNYGSAGLTQSDYQVTQPLVVKDVNGNDASVAVNAQTADEAFETVLAYAGAGIRADLRPRIDQQVMEEARTGNGYLTGGRDFDTLTSSDTALNEAIAKYDIKEMNYDEYYPTAITEKDITDSDNDGMSDEWELARGLNLNKNDATLDYLGQGYNNIEYYINDLTVDAFPEGVVEISPTTTDLGEEYTNAKEDAEAISLSPTTISKATDLTLPTTGTKHASSITWTSASSAIVIKNNKITAVNRPSEGNTNVSLVASVTNGGYTVKKYFTVTVLSTAASWTASAADVGKAAGTQLMTGLTNVSVLTGSSLDGNVIGGKTFTYYVSGTDNGSWADGKATGTAFKYVASEDGYLTGYITNLGENKTAYIIEEGASNHKTDYIASIVGTDGADQAITASVKAGKTYYLFVAGSKGRFAGVSFDTNAPVQMWKASVSVTAGAALMKNLTPAEDMTYTEKLNTNIDGIDFTGCISGTNNPRENGATGAALHYIAPADGILTVYYKIGSGKTFKINDTAGNVVDSYTNEDEASEYTSTTVNLTGGTTYYIYVAGSKAEFYGVSYQQTGEAVAPSTPDPNTTPAPTIVPTATPKPTMAPQWWKASKTVTTGETLMTGLISAGELTYTEKASTADGVEFTGYVNGTVNGKYADGVFSGNGVIFTAPTYGELKAYMEVGAGKTIKITDSEDNAIAEWTNDGEKVQTSISATVEAGKTYYAYVAGSKARIYGVLFEEKEAPATPVPTAAPTEEPKQGLGLVLDGNNAVCSGTIEEPDGKEVYIAQYGADGRLIAVTKTEAKESFSTTVALSENTATIKAMLWNGMEPREESVVFVK